MKKRAVTRELMGNFRLTGKDPITDQTGSVAIQARQEVFIFHLDLALFTLIYLYATVIQRIFRSLI